tara:strand:- start:1877 stop:2188 length:312 start_codon:yes stop_codon:yes gene_type:complete
MIKRTTHDSPPKWAKLNPTSGTFDKIAGCTQWPGGDAWFISQQAHDRIVRGALNGVQSCNCIGPQTGFPKCPCLMQGLEQRDGRWVEPEKDLGPVAAEHVSEV